MYVTRPLSLYKNSPDLVSAPLPEGPNSGYLVVQDEESLTPCCFGFCTSDDISDLPLPSNKILKFDYDSDDDDEILGIPVINHPLSSNKYYAIKAHTKHKGLAYVSSKEEDKGVCCGGTYIKDEKPTPLDPENIYQQFEFFTTITCSDTNAFSAKSVAPNSHPPQFLRSSTLNSRTSSRCNKDFIQGEATGLNSALRARLPDFNFPLYQEHSALVCVGNWYCPFMFICDGTLKDQVKNSVYYEMRLEQCWERIFTCESNVVQGNKVAMNVVDSNTSCFCWRERCCSWFCSGLKGVEERKQVWVLSSVIIERMVWEEERFGWIDAEEKQVRLVREEEYEGNVWWGRFGCYVLVERYSLKRMDGSLVMSIHFKHTNQIKTKWE